MLGAQLHILEEEFGRVLSTQPQLLETLSLFKPRHAAFHQKQAGAFGPRLGIGLGHYDHQVRMPAVGDEGLAEIGRAHV